MDGGNDNERLGHLVPLFVFSPQSFIPLHLFVMEISLLTGAEYIKYIRGGSITAWEWYKGVQSTGLLSMELV
jgi:hypothetical protein